MKLGIPIAGKEKHTNPHTLTLPKTLITITQSPIIQQQKKDIAIRTKEENEINGIVIHKKVTIDNSLTIPPVYMRLENRVKTDKIGANVSLL